MPTEIAGEFYWGVNKAGYKWIEARVRARKDGEFVSHPMLVAADLENQDHPLLRWFHPLQEQPALFRKLADTPANQSGIQQFANRYGRLGGQFSQRLCADETWRGESIYHAEPLITWKGQILSLRQAVTLWDLARAGDRAALEKLIH